MWLLQLYVRILVGFAHWNFLAKQERLTYSTLDLFEEDREEHMRLTQKKSKKSAS